MQKTINDTNVNIVNNNNKYVNFPNENTIDNNFLTLGNLENSPRVNQEGVIERRNKSNFACKQIKSDLNKNLIYSDLTSEDKEITKFFVNKKESSKTQNNINGKVSFLLNNLNKQKSLMKEDNFVSKMKRLNSNKNVYHVESCGFFDYHDYKNFFYLTFESIKNNTKKTNIFKEIDVEKLYKYSLIHSIPFYKVSLLF